MILREKPLPLPERCAIRLIDLDTKTGGALTVEDDGFVNIFISRRLSRDGQIRALNHELRHYYRDDLHSDVDIREVERLADGPVIVAADGTLLDDPAPAFAPEALRTVGRGLYKPIGENLPKAAADVDRVRHLLLEACGIYDVMQKAPYLMADKLTALAESLSPGDLSFIAWHMDGAVLHFFRQAVGCLYGAIYYDRSGRMDNALAAFELSGQRVSVDMRQRGGMLRVCSIFREYDDIYERVY